ncbi:uncharacterized protein LOC131614099 [Vicia villosa]|uniref:uncharacterized protein LOC131614099 n=1 Tax=Vicia villosa TaxID=3911 RepID=UPI00273CC12E|nr:uncharacterized protein LOC131614099 [Vicia villosa]
MATTTGQTEKGVSLKLLVNKDTNKVLFAEAGKDFVDVLFSFLTLPLGTIARLVEKKSSMGPVSVGCLNKLYGSLREFDKEYTIMETTKEMLLQPKNSSENYCSNLKLNIDDTQPTKFFLCTMINGCSYPRYLNLSTNKKCGCVSYSNHTRSVSLKYSCNGFVKDGSSFVITDNLVVIPNSVQFTSLGLLQDLEINGSSSVKELTVTVTKDKVLDMLKCSLLSKTTLTDLFIRNKPSLENYKYFSCHQENNCNIQINVKLVIRKSDGKILYAQGEKDFADLLLGFLSFPLGGVVRVLGENCFVGNIDSLYKSIVDLDETKYLTSKDAKNRLVDCRLAAVFQSIKHIVPIDYSRMDYYCFYQGENYEQSVGNHKFFVSDVYRSDWGKYELFQAELPKGSYEGYVKGPRAYMATDDLVLTPWSPISALQLINQLQIPLNDLQEMHVTIGVKECLSVLKASLISTSALTNGLCHLLPKVKEENVKSKLKVEVKEELNIKQRLRKRV